MVAGLKFPSIQNIFNVANVSTEKVLNKLRSKINFLYTYIFFTQKSIKNFKKYNNVEIKRAFLHMYILQTTNNGYYIYEDKITAASTAERKQLWFQSQRWNNCYSAYTEKKADVLIKPRKRYNNCSKYKRRNNSSANYKNKTTIVLTTRTKLQLFQIQRRKTAVVSTDEPEIIVVSDHKNETTRVGARNCGIMKFAYMLTYRRILLFSCKNSTFSLF